MTELLRADLDTGSLGLSTGLEYDPGIYAATSEVMELARVAAAQGGRYISHMRSEDRYFWESLDEIIRIGREADIPVQVSHMKLAMKGLWGEAGTALAILDAARAEGIEVTADVYPYPYWQSTLTVLFPQRNFDDLQEARYVLDQVMPPEGALIVDYLPEPAYAGKTLAQIAELRDEEPAVALLALIQAAEAARAQLDSGGPVESVIGTSMSESDIERLIAWPHSNFCTDGALHGTHPRGYGSFPRILGRYVRQRGVIRLEEAVRKASSLAAEHMGFADRGRIAVGQFADLVVFDPERVVDRATTDAPHTTSLGIEQVWVNGVRVWDGTMVTGERPGRILRR